MIIMIRYIGDCVMAFWLGDNHEMRSVECALECLEFIKNKCNDWLSRNLPAIEVRIGINSGPLLVGNFGSSNRFNYTGNLSFFLKN